MNTNHLIIITEMTREMNSMENTRSEALNSGNHGLARSLGRDWQRMNDARRDAVLKAMRAGIGTDVLTFVCQVADKWQLQDLRCDPINDGEALGMIERMIESAQDL